MSDYERAVNQIMALASMARANIVAVRTLANDEHPDLALDVRQLELICQIDGSDQRLRVDHEGDVWMWGVELPAEAKEGAPVKSAWVPITRRVEIWENDHGRGDEPTGDPSDPRR